MKSFIGWIGGKSRLRKVIIPMIPADCDRYIEVCGGAGWVLFGKEQNPKQMEVFNDADSNLINLYLQVKNNCKELCNEIDKLQSRELFVRYRDNLAVCAPLTDVQRAAQYLYLIKCSFGSNRYSFATTNKNLQNTIDYLNDVCKRLKNVIIENKDFESLIKTYDRPKALFYVDPPYVGTEKYYNGQFTTDDHKRLKSVLSNIKGRFILSYNDCNFVRELYKEYNIMEISRLNALPAKVEAQSEFKELIIKNF